MTQSTEQERAEFEAWYAGVRQGPIKRLDYEAVAQLDDLKTAYWFAWQAARRAPVVPSLTLPIQAGKKYLRRDGKRVIAEESHSPWKEQGLILALVIGDGQTWAHVSAETGRYSDADCDEDLMADCTAAAPQSACNQSMQPTQELRDKAEHEALREVYENARGVLRYDGIDAARLQSYMQGLSNAVEDVKLIDSGLWEPEVAQEGGK